MKNSLAVVILTYNEELNIGQCLKNVSGWTDEIFVVDSYSTDKTLEIAKKYGAKIVQHPFKNQAEQFNWALKELKIKTDWIFRLDSDEYLTEELKDEIDDTLPRTPDSVSGFLIKRRVYFMGRWMRHGGYYPTWFLRLFRTGKGLSEIREVDEHIILLEGIIAELDNDFVDNNKRGLEDWVAKHNSYSSREMRERFKDVDSSRFPASAYGSQTKRKRWLKLNFYMRLPLFIRPFLYFFYRYFIRLGFLDGKEGLIFHFLQACWHQFLIDAKIYEFSKKSVNRKE